MDMNLRSSSLLFPFSAATSLQPGPPVCSCPGHCKLLKAPPGTWCHMTNERIRYSLLLFMRNVSLSKSPWMESCKHLYCKNSPEWGMVKNASIWQRLCSKTHMQSTMDWQSLCLSILLLKAAYRITVWSLGYTIHNKQRMDIELLHQRSELSLHYGQSTSNCSL